MRSAAAGPLWGIATWLGSSTACVAMAASLGTATGPGAPVAIPLFYVEAFPELRNANPDLPITHVIGISSDSSREELIVSAPNLEIRNTMRSLLAHQRDTQMLVEVATAKTETVREGHVEVLRFAGTSAHARQNSLHKKHFRKFRVL